jgi:hypothetical protein
MIDLDTASNYSYLINNSIESAFQKDEINEDITIDEVIEDLEGNKYNSLEELKEDLKHLTKEEILKHLASSFEQFSKKELYKTMMKGLKEENPDIKEYLLHLCIFGWYREEYRNSLPDEKKSDLRDLFDVNNVKQSLDKFENGERVAIKVFTEEEFNELHKDDDNENKNVIIDK